MKDDKQTNESNQVVEQLLLLVRCMRANLCVASVLNDLCCFYWSLRAAILYEFCGQFCMNVKAVMTT